MVAVEIQKSLVREFKNARRWRETHMWTLTVDYSTCVTQFHLQAVSAVSRWSCGRRWADPIILGRFDSWQCCLILNDRLSRWRHSSWRAPQNVAVIPNMWRDKSQKAFLLIVAPPSGRITANLVMLFRVGSKVTLTNMVFVSQSISKICAHFLFGSFAIDFDWLPQALWRMKAKRIPLMWHGL